MMDINLKVKVDINPQFTEALCFLAAALGYPSRTMAQELKEIAQEVKAKKEAEEAKELSKPHVKQWEWRELQKYCLDLTQKSSLTAKEVTELLKKFKDNNDNPVQSIEVLVKQKTPNEVNEFVKLIKERAGINDQRRVQRTME